MIESVANTARSGGHLSHYSKQMKAKLKEG